MTPAQAFFPLAIWRWWLLLPRPPMSTHPSHGDSPHPRKPTYPLASPQRAKKKRACLGVAPWSPGLGRQWLRGGSPLPLSAGCPHSPHEGPAHAAPCSAHRGLAGALWVPTLPASTLLVRIRSWTSWSGPSFSGAGGMQREWKMMSNPHKAVMCLT